VVGPSRPPGGCRRRGLDPLWEGPLLGPSAPARGVHSGAHHEQLRPRVLPGTRAETQSRGGCAPARARIVRRGHGRRGLPLEGRDRGPPRGDDALAAREPRSRPVLRHQRSRLSRRRRAHAGHGHGSRRAHRVSAARLPPVRGAASSGALSHRAGADRPAPADGHRRHAALEGAPRHRRAHRGHRTARPAHGRGARRRSGAPATARLPAL
jgi:hypothetical protein